MLGFYGERLREAREARALTASQLAELIGVTKQAVNMYEKSRCRPSEEVFEKISKVLRIPKRYFVRPPQPASKSPIFYRSMASATQKMRMRAERRLGWIKEILSFLSQYIDFPTINIPDIKPPSDPLVITEKMIEEAAASLREHWKLGEGVINNVALLMENGGVIGSRFNLAANKLDAFSVWDDYTQRPLLVLTADKECAARSRFDAAHELGHLLIHRNVPKPLLANKTVFALMEDQAHYFGRAFLLPARPFARGFLLPTLNTFKNMKQKWKLSIGLMIKRSEELGLISHEQANRLWINRSRQGWATREPFDDEIPPEQPVLLSRSVKLLIDSGKTDAETFLDELGLPAEDVEELTGVSAGYLTGKPVLAKPETEPEPRLLSFPHINAS
jgi:Zn-dependent peptidase ImmA (M78 family)/DNA-binding XRE family transcriptional regulator